MICASTVMIFYGLHRQKHENSAFKESFFFTQGSLLNGFSDRLRMNQIKFLEGSHQGRKPYSSYLS